MNNPAKRTLDILELLARCPEALSVTWVAKAPDIPKTSAFDILNVLPEKGFVRIDDPALKTYTLGFSAYRVGMAYISRMDLYTAAHSRLSRLRDTIAGPCIRLWRTAAVWCIRISRNATPLSVLP